MSDEGISKLMELEGCRLESYRDSGGQWTIGFGHLQRHQYPQKITIEYAKQLLYEDIEVTENCINGTKERFTQCQFDALCMLVYNIGVNAFLKSRLLRYIKSNAPQASIASEWVKWCHVKGHVNYGLWLRRRKEIEWYESV